MTNGISINAPYRAERPTSAPTSTPTPGPTSYMPVPYQAPAPVPQILDAPPLLAVPLSTPEIRALENVIAGYREALDAVVALKAAIAAVPTVSCACGATIEVGIVDTVSLERLHAQLARVEPGVGSVVRRSYTGTGATLWYGDW